MLLRCCLIHIAIIIKLRHILHIVYLGPFVGLGLVMSYLCDIFLIFSLIFFVMNHITSFKQVQLFFCTFLEYSYYFWTITWCGGRIIFKQQKFSFRVLLSFCLIFCQFQPGVAYKNVAYKKSVQPEQCLPNYLSRTILTAHRYLLLNNMIKQHYPRISVVWLIVASVLLAEIRKFLQ